MAKPKVFITRRIPQAGLDMLAGQVHAEVWPEELPPSPETLREKVRGVDGLLSLLTDRVDASLIEAVGPDLKVISQFAVGYDNIDVAAATARGIPVGNTPDVLTDATADFTWALLMAAARRVLEGDRVTRSGQWRTWGPTTLLGSDFVGATLGLIGYGRIGQAVARRASGFSMRVVYYEPNPFADLPDHIKIGYAQLNDLLARSDFISLHTPLTPQTRGMISHAQFDLMKPSAVLVNTARGAIIDQQALYQALREHKIAAAAIDVTDPEPIPANSPLLTLDNLIVTPHIASASVQARTKMAEMAAANLLAGLKGEPLPNCVNPQVYGGR